MVRREPAGPIEQRFIGTNSSHKRNSRQRLNFWPLPSRRDKNENSPAIYGINGWGYHVKQLPNPIRGDRISDNLFCRPSGTRYSRRTPPVDIENGGLGGLFDD